LRKTNPEKPAAAGFLLPATAKVVSTYSITPNHPDSAARLHLHPGGNRRKNAPL